LRDQVFTPIQNKHWEDYGMITLRLMWIKIVKCVVRVQLQHYYYCTNIKLGIVHCLRYVWYTCLIQRTSPTQRSYYEWVTVVYYSPSQNHSVTSYGA
jgi:hypothetical protein